MNERKVVGLTPWYPWPLSRYTWWTEPVRAERLAAFRIGVALVLLCDILSTYLPRVHDFFGQNGLGSPDVFAAEDSRLNWTMLASIRDPDTMKYVLFLWAGAALFLLLGWVPRISAAIAWLLSIWTIGLNSYIHNSGDAVRSISLFYLMLSPCGAAWVWRPWQSKPPVDTETYIPAWPVRLLAVQLTVIYFVNGVYKFASGD